MIIRIPTPSYGSWEIEVGDNQARLEALMAGLPTKPGRTATLVYDTGAGATFFGLPCSIL